MDGIAGDTPQAKSNPVTSPKKFTVVVRIEPDGGPKRLDGRAGWMIRELIKAGTRGVTTVELPAGIRVSHAVYLLRREGFVISMQREAHGGEFAGVHGRFRIETPCTILDDLAVAA